MIIKRQVIASKSEAAVERNSHGSVARGKAFYEKVPLAIPFATENCRSGKKIEFGSRSPEDKLKSLVEYPARQS
jgi:hypothetical protein